MCRMAEISGAVVLAGKRFPSIVEEGELKTWAESVCLTDGTLADN